MVIINKMISIEVEEKKEVNIEEEVIEEEDMVDRKKKQNIKIHLKVLIK